MNKILAWHFLQDDCKMRFNSDITVKPGVEYKATLPLIMCENGLHASERIIDALNYAPGPVVCRVELSGEMIKDEDKICAENRKVLWMYDATNVLHEFACAVAEQALLKGRESGKEPDPRSWQAIKVKRRWLKGEASSEELEAARAAAWEAWEAREAAEATAWAAARAAARAAGAAAWEAAWAAAWAAAEATAWAAAEEEYNTYNTLLKQMIMEAYKDE